MRVFQYKPSPLMMAMLSIPLILFTMLFIFWVTERYFDYPSTYSQKATAFYAAIIFSLLPLAAYILLFISEKKGLFAVKAFGADITFDFSKNMVDIQQLDRPDDFFSPETYQYQNVRSSEPKHIVRAILRLTKSPVVSINIKAGQSWWLSRLFALTAGAIYLGLPLDAIVFVGTKENIEKTFISWAEPRPIFESIIRAYPSYGEIYMNSIAIYNQIVLFPPNLPTDYSPKIKHTNIGPDDDDPTHSFELNFRVAKSAPKESIKEITFLDILISKLEEPPGRIMITKSLISDMFEHSWHLKVLDLNWSNEKQVKAVLNTKESYIPLVKQGNFEGMIKSQIALNSILKQVWLPTMKESKSRTK